MVAPKYCQVRILQAALAPARTRLVGHGGRASSKRNIHAHVGVCESTSEEGLAWAAEQRPNRRQVVSVLDNY